MTWNLLLLAVDKAHHGRGLGKQILTAVELRAQDRARARMLIIETSSTGEFDRTRASLLKQGYTEAARIADFYDDATPRSCTRSASRSGNDAYGGSHHTDSFEKLWTPSGDSIDSTTSSLTVFCSVQLAMVERPRPSGPNAATSLRSRRSSTRAICFLPRCSTP
ncbi:hypothetical protein PINS_up019782 [Pythium insidiosum]|nr:hypothetical protein PINS_up019782 [Pythium insidiosum]